VGSPQRPRVPVQLQSACSNTDRLVDTPKEFATPCKKKRDQYAIHASYLEHLEGAERPTLQCLCFHRPGVDSADQTRHRSLGAGGSKTFRSFELRVIAVLGLFGCSSR
jgi:hypothetical protein